MHRHLLTVAVTLVAFRSIAAASPSYSMPVTEATRTKALEDLLKIAEKEGVGIEAAKLLLASEVIPTMSRNTRCPGVEVDILNATAHVMWDVDVEIEQTDKGKKRTDTLHLPWMPANTQTRVTVSCIEDYETHSRYDFAPVSKISIALDGKGYRSLAEALPLMLEQPVDFLNKGTEVTVRDAHAGERTLLAEALAMADSDDASDATVVHDLVTTIAKTGIGAKELGDELTRNGSGALADEVVSSMAKLPPLQQSQLARTLLASKVADRWHDKLQTMIDTRLCTGPRADVMTLWIRAQNTTDIPVESLRDRVRDKCKLQKGDGAALVAALDADSSRSAALDAVDADLFAGAVVAWRAAKKPSLSLFAFLRVTADDKRFTAAAQALTAATQLEAITSVLDAPDNAALAAKAAWLTAVTDKLTPDAAEATVKAIYEALVHAPTQAPAMREAARATRSHSEAAADAVLDNAGGLSTVFDPSLLAAAHVDRLDYLALSTTSLGECTLSVDKLSACADAIAAYQPRTGTASLFHAAGGAERPAFVEAVAGLTRSLDGARTIKLAKQFGAAGLSVERIVAQLCTKVGEALRYDSDQVGAMVAEVAQIDPTASCIAGTSDALAARKHKAVLMTIAALLGLVLPVPAGFWFARRRWRKLQRALPATDAVTGGANLEDRLGGRGLGRALGTALAEARRELAGTPAQDVLAAIDDAMLASVATTTQRAVKSGDAASLIVKRGGDAVYIVALPIRQVRPQIVQRYLGAAWPEHLEAVRRAAGMPVLALIVMCGPDAAEATLLVGYNDGNRSSDPDALLDARDARERGANTFRHVMALSVEATASATAPTSAKAA